MPLSDRRRSPRAPVQTTATLFSSDARLGAFEVVNLGAGGLLLAGATPAPPGTEIGVVLPMPNADPLVLRAHILRERRAPDGAGFVVTFFDLPPDVVARLADAVAAAASAAASAHVLVVDDAPAAAQALRLELARLGHAAHAVSSPLEALRVLERPNRVAVAFVDLVLGPGTGLDLMAYLAEQHPYVRRVLMAGDREAGQLGHTLRERPHAAPHEVLGKPWNSAALARAVGGV